MICGLFFEIKLDKGKKTLTLDEVSKNETKKT